MPQSRILVVDDDAWILRMVSTILEKRGHEVDTARDGEEGLAKALASPPDLIISDVMMPRLDGWALVKQLRSRPELALVPVIFLTALGSEDDRIRGFRLGADDYLPKPFRFEELDLRVAKALRHRPSDAPASTQLRNARAPEVAAAKAKPPWIHGALDQLGLSSLLMVLEMERKSGVLVLTRARDGATEIGRVFLRGGRVARARLDGKPAPKNHQAI